MRQSIWESVGVQIPRFKPAEWDRITAVIPRLWEDQDIGAEATERGEVASMRRRRRTPHAIGMIHFLINPLCRSGNSCQTSDARIYKIFIR